MQAGKIAVLGESMGGERALAAMGADPRIRAGVAEGATGQQTADHGWRPNDITGTIDLYDALVALGAKEHWAALATRDARAPGTYDAVGGEVIVVT